MAVGDSSTGGGWVWLDQGLLGGAVAVGLAGQVGQIAPGAFADLLVVDLAVPGLTPSRDLPWELVRLAGRDQIEAAITHCRLRLQNGRPVDWDGDALLETVRELAARAVAAAPICRVDPAPDERRARRREWRG